MYDFLNTHQLMHRTFEEIEALQNMKFRATVHHLLPRVKFYAELFKLHGVDFREINSVEDWKKKGLPLIKKSAYMKRPKDFVVKPKLKDHMKYLASMHKTGKLAEMIGLVVTRQAKEEMIENYLPKMMLFSAGTESGKPTPVVITKKQKQEVLPELMRIIQDISPYKGQITGMNLFPFGPHLAWHSTNIGFEIADGLNLSTAAGGAMRTENLARLSGEIKPNVIAGMSSYLRQRFLPECIKQKITLPKKVVFVNGAAKMHDGERGKIKALAEKLGVKKCHVLDCYGASELKEGLMSECKQGLGFHQIAPLSNIIRTVKFESTKTDLIYDWEFTEKEGYAVNWNIDGGGTLLQGYVIGDKFLGILKERCPNCKLNVIRVKKIDRIRDVETQIKVMGMAEAKVKGTRVNLSAIREKLLKLDEVKEAQVIAERNKLKILIVQEKGKALNKARQALKCLEVKPEIKIVRMEQLKKGKMKFEGIIINRKL